MREKRLLLLLSSSAFLIGGFCPPAWATSNLNVVLGIREMDDSWSPADVPFTVGVHLDYRKSQWPVSLALGYQFSEDDTEGCGGFFVIFCVPAPRTHTRVSELSVGAVRHWREKESARPFLGAGLAILNTDFEDETSGIDESDSTQGIYANAGVAWAWEGFSRLVPSMGFEVRTLLGADVEFAGVEGDADYLQVAFVFGLTW